MNRATNSTAPADSLFCAVELSKNSWLLGIQFPDRQKASVHPLKGGDSEGLMAKLVAACDRWTKISGKKPSIILCYEAGYDAFWLARFLKARGTFGSCPHARDGVADDGSRWRCPGHVYGFDAGQQNGPAASEPRCRCASLHHGPGLLAPPNRRMWRDFFVHHIAGSPRLRHPDTGQVCRRARSRQGWDLRWRADAAILDRFCARRLTHLCGSGRGNGISDRTRKLTMKKKRGRGAALTENSP